MLTNASGTLYTGVTNDLERRLFEHKSKLIPGFTTKYNLDRLIYFEVTGDVESAITREKQVKGWTRAKKLALIDSLNPNSNDLSEAWLGEEIDSSVASGRPQNDTKTPLPFAGRGRNPYAR
jgi:putative endonuclease